MIVRILRDEQSRHRIVTDDVEEHAKQRYRAREQAVLDQEKYLEQRELVLDYERYRRTIAETVFAELSDTVRQGLRKEKLEVLKQQDRYERLDPSGREREAEELILQDLARKEAAPYEKWFLRKRAQQAVLPFSGDAAAV